VVENRPIPRRHRRQIRVVPLRVLRRVEVVREVQSPPLHLRQQQQQPVNMPGVAAKVRTNASALKQMARQTEIGVNSVTKTIFIIIIIINISPILD
jgi:hypothetical protein